MALSDYAAFLAWAGAALMVYAGASVARRRGWVSTDYLPKAAVVLLTGVLVRRAAAPKPGQSRVPQAVITEAAAGRAPRDEASSYDSLPIIAVCLVLTACVALEVARRRRRRRSPPPQIVPERRYADRRRA
ncbi:hypothetical protein HU200_033368 [Digitaria exilis]|uniref:Uncharacterized protein n=1 Tax=Digitaria exilis TaxID=1010633 RepID=A0A835EKZ7_9POAL|nr:hypothetical protein HU200_033368 [Digitaria exilis]